MKFLLHLTLFFTFICGVSSLVFKHVSPEEIKEFSVNILDPGFYVALVNPDVKFIRVTEGMRKEQIIEEVKHTFNWSENDVLAFAGFDELRDEKFEGKFFPGSYVVPKDTTGLELKQMMLERFNTKMSSEGIEVDIRKNNFDTDTILTIASIIQREAGSKSDMYLVSGIIWNRIFTNMSLQMDATLQYAKGTAENGWWPKVVPDDKYIESPYNTYKNKGLPPSPIANPGFAAIHAALHPKETECIFYFHKNRKNYCSKTYEEHKRKIDLYLK